MPIIGKTTREAVNLRYPSIGSLNKGDPKPDKGAGRERPYFRFESHSEGAKQVFADAFGDKPIAVRAYLPYPTAEENFSTWIEAWEPGEGGAMLWRSNGEHSVRRWVPELKTFSDREQDQLPHAQLPRQDLAQWKGRLSLLFPELFAAGVVGTVTLRTGGINDCTRIIGALYKLEDEAERAGRPTGIKHVEVVIDRRAVRRKDPGSGNRYDHWDVFLAPAETWVQVQLEAAQREMSAQLPANVRIVDQDTGEVIYDREEAMPNEVVREAIIAPEAPPETPDPVPQARTKTGKVVEGKAPKVRPASIKGCSDWAIQANELADGCPFYMGERGPDFALMLQVAGAKGFETVTDENIADVIAALELHATTENSVAAAQEGESF